MTYILGIDPGLSGALAWYKPAAADEPLDLLVEDVETFEVVRNDKHKRELNLSALWDLLAIGADDTNEAFVELVNAIPKQGVSSVFSFGSTFGAIKMGLTAARIPMTLVAPQRWKRAVGLKTGATKGESRRRACELFPAHTSFFKRAKDDGRAEAALIAYWGVHCAK